MKNVNFSFFFRVFPNKIISTKVNTHTHTTLIDSMKNFKIHLKFQTKPTNQNRIKVWIGLSASFFLLFFPMKRMFEERKSWREKNGWKEICILWFYWETHWQSDWLNQIKSKSILIVFFFNQKKKKSTNIVQSNKKTDWFINQSNFLIRFFWRAKMKKSIYIYINRIYH